MFYGEFEHAIDEKGRLSIPSRLRSPLRDAVIDQFVITRGFEKCLYMFAPNDWHRVEKQFRALPITKTKSRAFLRMFFSGASLVDCDKQGRVLVPKNLLDHAGIEKDVMIVGVSSRIEIWNKKDWKDYFENTKQQYAEMAEQLIDFDPTESNNGEI